MIWIGIVIGIVLWAAVDVLILFPWMRKGVVEAWQHAEEATQISRELLDQQMKDLRHEAFNLDEYEDVGLPEVKDFPPTPPCKKAPEIEAWQVMCWADMAELQYNRIVYLEGVVERLKEGADRLRDALKEASQPKPPVDDDTEVIG